LPPTVTPTATWTDDAGSHDDGGNWELGIHGTAGDLPAATAAERAGMSYWLAPASNWTQNYSFDESTAWEEDFKRSALGGTENYYVDSVDLQFYVGHGWPGGFTFFNAAHDDASLVPTDCYRSWGNGDNEWLALTSSQVLANSNLSSWAACMNDQHLIMGFATNASAYNSASSTQAYHFSRYIWQNYSMAQAWYKACDVTQRGRITRTIINELDCLNDKPNLGRVCADSYDWDWWYQTHSCDAETAIYVPAEGITQLPVFKANALSVEEANIKFANLVHTFNLTLPSEGAIGADDSPFFVTEVNSRMLEMDKNSGLFNYSDLNELWTTQQAIRSMEVNAASPAYISSDDAKVIADAFLHSSGLGAGDALFYKVVSDTISTAILLPEDLTMVASLDTVQEDPIAWRVNDSRSLTAPAVNVVDILADQEFSAVGSVAEPKVYVPAVAPVDAAYEVVSDNISSEIVTHQDPIMSFPLDDVQENSVLWQVIYSRRLTAPVINAAGTLADQEFSVVGSGSQQKVYVPVVAPAGAASVLETQPIGVQAGWRKIEHGVNAATGEALYVTILTFDKVKALYEAIPDKVALNHTLMQVDGYEIISHTIAYWEEPIGVNQGELIPVYELKLKLIESQSKAEVEDFVYVPASPLYMRPVAKIVGTPTEDLEAGTSITVAALDATKTLKELGLGDFDIVLGNGDYLYEWYQDDTLISTERELDLYFPPAPNYVGTWSFTFELRVRDTQSPNPNTVGTDKVTVIVNYPIKDIFLPFVSR
jgi:hypothetical protein